MPSWWRSPRWQLSRRLPRSMPRGPVLTSPSTGSCAVCAALHHHRSLRNQGTNKQVRLNVELFPSSATRQINVGLYSAVGYHLSRGAGRISRQASWCVPFASRMSRTRRTGVSRSAVFTGGAAAEWCMVHVAPGRSHRGGRQGSVQKVQEAQASQCAGWPAGFEGALERCAAVTKRLSGSPLKSSQELLSGAHGASAKQGP